MSFTLKPTVIANDSDDFDLWLLKEKISKQKALYNADVWYNAGTVEIGTHFARVYVALGALAIALNITILIILLIHRRHAFRHVFYLLIFNFATIDCLKGVCLIAYGLRMIKTAQLESIKFDQIMTMIFRFCNLATILNLLMITLNEFVFIKFPLRYHQLIDRRLTLILISLKWLLCIVFTAAFTYSKGTGGRVYVSANYTSDFGSSSVSMQNNGSVRSSIWRQPDGSSQGMDVHYIFAFTLTAFCLVCLAAVLICYAVFFRVIREIQQYDSRLYQDANRRISEMSTNSCEIPAGTNSGDRKLKRQLLRRNKYAFVIGLVILVCMLYLLTYSIIQIFQFFNLDKQWIGKQTELESKKRRKSYVVRWVLQILVGLHSIFQPLCYFRMKEFRQYVYRLFCLPFLSANKGGPHSNGIPDRDYFTSCAETAPTSIQQQNKLYNKRASRNSIVMVKSTNHFRGRIYFIFSRKKQRQHKQTTLAVERAGEDCDDGGGVGVGEDQSSPQATNNNKIRRSLYYEDRHQETTINNEELAKELATLMQNNSGTDL